MALAKKQSARPTSLEHIVPASYLQNFTTAANILYVYESGKPIRESIPRRECAEHGFYEFQLRGKKSNNAYEKWLAQTESFANRVIPLLCSRQKLDGQDAVVWAAYVGLLFARTRKVREQFSVAMMRKMHELVESAEYIRELQHDLLKRGELRSFEEIRSHVQGFQSEIESSPSYYHVTGLPRKVAVLADSLLRMKWWTLDASADSFFVTTDSPVITIQRQQDCWTEGAGFAREGVAILLPLSPKKLFAASRFLEFKLNPEKLYVEQINRVLIRFAHRNVYADRRSDGIQRLVDSEISQIVFGKNAFLPPSA